MLLATSSRATCPPHVSCHPGPCHLPLIATPDHATCSSSPSLQLVDELLAFWSLEDYEEGLAELEEALIVSEQMQMRADRK